MKRHIAVLILVTSLAPSALTAQQRSPNPASAAIQNPAPLATQADQLRQAQELLQRLRNTPNMPETDRVNALRTLSDLLANLQRTQETLPALAVVAPAGVRSLQLNPGTPINPDLVGYVRMILAPVDGTNPGRIIVRNDATAWWTNTALLTRLGITDDQKSKIDRTFESHKQNLTTTKDQLEKEETQLDKLLAADTLDHAGIVAQINRVVQARSDMERANSLMTLDMREVLTKAQWTQLQAQPIVGGGLYTIRTPTGTVVAPVAAPLQPGGIGARGAGQRGIAPAPAPAKQ
jgi:hypothetical protein